MHCTIALTDFASTLLQMQKTKNPNKQSTHNETAKMSNWIYKATQVNIDQLVESAMPWHLYQDYFTTRIYAGINNPCNWNLNAVAICKPES